MSNKRLSFVNFPIPFDHPYTLPILSFTVSVSAFAYYYLQASHVADLLEARRRREINRRRQLQKPNDRYASMKFDETFVNPFVEWQDPSWRDAAVFWWSWCRRRLGSRDKQQSPEHFLSTLLSSHPTKQTLTESWVNLDSRPSGASSSSPSLSSFTWLGQSTSLLHIAGLTILVDPMFGDRIAQTSRGLGRPAASTTSVQDIQSYVNIVLVTHDHPDHLDERVVLALGDHVTWYTPTGLREWFNTRKVYNVIELDWWQEIHHKERPELVIASVPAMHGSGQLLERNKSLWCGYVIKVRDENVFICGSSGYSSEMFTAIRAVYEPFSLAVIPVDGSGSRNAFCIGQMEHSEALMAHKDLGSPQTAVYIRNEISLPKDSKENPLQENGYSMVDNEHVQGNNANFFKTVVPGETLYFAPSEK